MSTYFCILTNVGTAKLANATALGQTLSLSKMALGDGGGSLPTPDQFQTSLVNEVRRELLNSVAIDADNPNWIVCEQVIPANEGGWTIRETGLYDEDGDLVAVGNFPETYKPVLEEGSGRTQTIRMVIQVSNAATVTLKIDPSVVLATREYVDEKDAAHIAADDPHTQYKEYADGKDEAHVAADNPHPQYHDASKLNAGTVSLERLPSEVLTTEKIDFVGSIHFFATETPPVGFLKANGAELSRVTYARLFSVIGTSWGEGDGSTTFHIPDARGEFLRGWDDGRGVDSDRILGSWQGDEIRSHRHSMTIMRTQEDGYTGAQKAANGTTNEGNMTWQTNYSGGNETRPRNLAGLICIKY
jgi:phage-related tail fiber protein